MRETRAEEPMSSPDMLISEKEVEVVMVGGETARRDRIGGRDEIRLRPTRLTNAFVAKKKFCSSSLQEVLVI